MTTTSQTIVSEPSRKGGLAGWMQRHQLLAAYGIVFLLAWGVVFVLLINLRSSLPDPVSFFLQVLVGWSPAIAAVVVSAVTGGRAAVRDLLRRFLILRVGPHWYLLALLLMAVVILGGVGLSMLFGGPPPEIPAAGAAPLEVIAAFLVLMVVGVLVNTEEVLWRGFALPRLQSRHSFLVACLLLAIPEVLLHLPNFFDPDAAFYRTVGIFWFSVFSVAAVILYAWVFNKTRGSLLIVTLLHASQNAWSNLLSDNSLQPFQFTVGIMVLIAVMLVARSARSPKQRIVGENERLPQTMD